jgi:hypothetical protein
MMEQYFGGSLGLGDCSIIQPDQEFIPAHVDLTFSAPPLAMLNLNTK